VYGNFILRDSRTGELSGSYGVRSLHDVALGAGIRDNPDFQHLLSTGTTRHLGAALLDGSALGHFANLFAGSDNHVVGLVQVVLCVDTHSRAKWLRGLESARLYQMDSNKEDSRA
jgi:hypothetical protein